MKKQTTMPEFLDLVKEYFNDGDIKTIFEIGALDGKDSLFFKSVYPEANIYCFEGLPENYETYHNGLLNINHINMVLTDYNGVIDFHKKRINGIHSIFNRGDEYGTKILKNLSCSRVDTICEKLKIISIDMVKIDVEGATHQDLSGFGDMLKNTKIMHIETETYPFFKGQKLHDEVVKFLTDNNFTMIEISGVDITHNGKQFDSVWVNNKFLKNKTK